MKNIKEVPVSGGSSSGCSFVPSVDLWLVQKQRGMKAKGFCSGMTSRTLGSSSVLVKAVLSALVVERP
jgi:hypothetical protein